MKHKNFICLGSFLLLILFACRKDNNPESKKDALTEVQTTANYSSGATQISGIGFYATAGECDYVSQNAAYAIKMTGDLQGCLYAFIEDYECSPSGTYREVGREYFVGTYNGQPGTFWTTYKFEARYEDCDGGPLGAEIFGRCQHPIVAGSGTGAFSGVTGQLNFKDDIEAGNFPYRGHLRF
ncbi:MAG TPA: hypothetical protein VGD17_19275 [Chitinophagaceae bacterium]